MLTISFPGIFIPVKAKDYRQLKKSYSRYRAEPSSLVAQFELESSYWRCYKKKASAKLIHSLAQLEWGPFRAWDVFGKSSPALLQYDYTVDSVKENWGFRWPKTWALFSSLSLPISYLLSSSILFGGLLLSWKLISLWTLFSIDELINSAKALTLFFFMGALMPVTLGFGAASLYMCFLSARSAKFDSAARKLKQLLDEQQTD